MGKRFGDSESRLAEADLRGRGDAEEAEEAESVGGLIGREAAADGSKGEALSWLTTELGDG